MDNVLAYLDPGSGSIVLQALLGGIAGLLVAVKMFGRRITRFFKFWDRDGDDLDRTKSEADG